MVKIYKEDYKNYRECGKLVYLLNKKQHFKTLEWQNQELTYFFEIPDFGDSENQQSQQISEADLKLFNSDNYSLLDLEVINSEAIIDGLEAGHYAKQYFMRDYKCFDLDDYEKSLVAKKTSEKILDETIDILFEPRFEYNGCVTKVDVLRRNGTGWDLIEVKATTNPKKEHFFDVFYQYYVLTNCNIEIKNVYLMHLNSGYQHHGDLDYDNLFVITNMYNLTTTGSKKENIMSAIAKEMTKRDINQDISRIKEILTMPADVALSWMKSNECLNNGKYNYCIHVFDKLPAKHTIFNLYRLTKTKQAKIYYEDNFLSLKENNFFNLNLTPNQYRQIKVVNGLEECVAPSERNYLQKVYQEYQYPIYMYDFETIKMAIPKYEGTTPYEQIPFQYSVHILLNDKFDSQKDQIVHYEYLATGEYDFRLELVKKLVNDLTTYGIGTYVAYNKSFEKGVLKKLAKLYPEYEAKLLEIAEKTLDLMDFFKKFAIYHPEFNGSFSIKKTLPAFSPEFSYQDLAIQKGTDTSTIFRKRVYDQWALESNNIFFKKLVASWNSISLEDLKLNHHANMLRYCERDTYGMVVLFQKISQLLREKGLI